MGKIWYEKSAMAVVVCKGKILTTKENIYGNEVFSLPKGHIENGETMIETAIRECFEETNVVLTEEDLVCELTEFDYTFTNHNGRQVRKVVFPLLFVIEDFGNPQPKEKQICSVEYHDLLYFAQNCTHVNVKNITFEAMRVLED